MSRDEALSATLAPTSSARGVCPLQPSREPSRTSRALLRRNIHPVPVVLTHGNRKNLRLKVPKSCSWTFFWKIDSSRDDRSAATSSAKYECTLALVNSFRADHFPPRQMTNTVRYLTQPPRRSCSDVVVVASSNVTFFSAARLASLSHRLGHSKVRSIIDSIEAILQEKTTTSTDFFQSFTACSRTDPLGESDEARQSYINCWWRDNLCSSCLR